MSPNHMRTRNNGRRRIGWAVVAAALVCLPARAAEIQCVGVLGNSGQFGEAIVRAPVSIEENALPTGVYVDADFTIWWGAGDAIAHLSLDGRRLESFAIDPPGSRVETTRFAVIGRTLYFAGRTPEGKSLFALPLDGPPRRSATALAVRLPEGDATWLRMAAEPLDGRELLFALPSRDVSRITVFSLEPATGRMNKRFSLPGHYLDGLAWNQSEGVLYVGAALRGPALDQGILACDLHGKRRDGSFPAATVPTPAQPTSFRGRVSLAGGALWDSGHYGYLARMDLRARGCPGIVGRWLHPIDEVTQVVGLDGDNGRFTPLLLATNAGDACWLAQWDSQENAFQLRRRFGALPVISSLAISPEGWVTVGTAQSQYWWRWEDAADAPPMMGDMSVAITPGVFSEGKFYALGAIYGLHDLKQSNAIPLIFEPKVFNCNSAERPGDAQPTPLKRPVGLTVASGPRPLLLATDAATRQLWRAELDQWPILPRPQSWKPATIAGAKLSEPTDVAQLDDGSLVLADGGRLLRLAREGDGFRVVRTWPSEYEADKPGGRLRLAADGPNLLVSDEIRGRVLWLDATSLRRIGQFGQIDQAGAGLRQLRGPTLVALRGRRAAVADAGNQRVLKLVLQRP